MNGYVLERSCRSVYDTCLRKPVGAIGKIDCRNVDGGVLVGRVARQVVHRHVRARAGRAERGQQDRGRGVVGAEPGDDLEVQTVALGQQARVVARGDGGQ